MNLFTSSVAAIPCLKNCINWCYRSYALQVLVPNIAYLARLEGTTYECRRQPYYQTVKKLILLLFTENTILTSVVLL